MHELYGDLINSDPKLLATVVAFFGTFIAAALASIGYLYRMRIEQKKSFRKVLYFLLEIRNSVLANLFDPETAAKQYFEHIESKLSAFGNTSPIEIPEQIRMMIVEHFRSVVSTQATDIKARLLAPFEQALLEMASINPTLAYRLYGKEKVMELVDHTRRYESEVVRSFTQDLPETIGPILRETSVKQTKSALHEISALLDDDIRLLAANCGIRERFQCWRILKKNLEYRNKIDFDELDTGIDELIREVVATFLVHNQINPPASSTPTLTEH